jgi:hypothetical protein
VGVACVTECECVSVLCIYMCMFFSVRKCVFECVYVCETVTGEDRAEF